MNTNFQPLSEQECKEINGGLDLPGVIIGLPDLQAIAAGLGNAIVSLSASVSGILNNLASTISNLLGTIKL